jgi:hypothetical protein
MIMNNQISLNSVSICLNKRKVEKLKYIFDEQYLKLLYLICKDLENKYCPWNKEIDIICIKFEQGLFEKLLCEVARRTIPKNHEKEYSALGLALCYLFENTPGFSEPEVYDAEGEGFDFEYKGIDGFHKLEVSGVYTGNKETFIDRISSKRIKFMNKKYHSSDFITEDVFIVDFFFQKYTYWDTKLTNNYKGDDID